MKSEIIPKIIHQTWKTQDSIPQQVRPYVDSVKRFHPSPDFQYMFYSDKEVDSFVKTFAPEGHYRIWKQEFLENIERFDYFRYLVLYILGGIYLDLDVECLRSLAPLIESEAYKHHIILGYECPEHNFQHGRRKTELFLGNAVLISPPNQPFWKDLLNFIINRYHDQGSRFKLLQSGPVNRTGPMALTRFWESSIARRDQYPVTILSPCAFYPKSDNWNPKHKIGNQESISNVCDSLEFTYCIHHWHHSWSSPWMAKIMPYKHELIQVGSLLGLILVAYAIVYGVFWLQKRTKQKRRESKLDPQKQ